MPFIVSAERVARASHARVLMLALGAAALASPSIMLGQTVVVPDAQVQPERPSAKPSPKALEIEAERRWNKRRYDAERELRRIRGVYLRQTRDDAKRAEGLDKLRAFTDPAAFGPLLDVMADQQEDVLRIVIGLYDADAGNAGESALVAAMLELESPAARTEAAKRFARRLAAAGTPGPGARRLIDAAIRGGDSRRRQRALEYVEANGLVEFLPSLIQGQIEIRADGNPPGDNGNISIGNQITYVQRLRPVIGENSAAFDPEVGTLNTGTQLRIRNAYVTIRRPEVNTVLVRMSDELTGQSTAAMGFDIKEWTEWYTRQAQDRVRLTLDARITAAKQSAAARAAQPAPAAAPALTPAPAQPRMDVPRADAPEATPPAQDD